MKPWELIPTKHRPAALFALVAATIGITGNVAYGQTAIMELSRLSDKCDLPIASKLAVVAGKHSTDIKGWTSVIVRTSSPLTQDQERAIWGLSGDIYKRLPIIQSAAVRIPTRNLARLIALPCVQHVSADDTVQKNDEFTTQHSNATSAWDGYGVDGSGVTVAVIDSGITSHNDLKDWRGNSRVLANVSFTSDGKTTDACGHGTHVAGIIAGNGSNSTGANYYRTFYGVAQNANLVNVRVLDANGSGSVSSVISGINWVVQNKNNYNIRVINLSLGHPVGESYKTDPLCQAVEAAYRSGIVVVCAAGNNGRQFTLPAAGSDNEGWGTNYGSIQSPGNDPYVITVGAMKVNPASPTSRSADLIATYSSRGPSRLDLVMKPDLVAPGNAVISLDARGSNLDINQPANVVPRSAYVSWGSPLGRSYYTLSGTSMAAPVVSGAVALMLDMNGSLSPDDVKLRLMLTATKMKSVSGKTDPCTYGAGYVDILAAINSTDRARLSTVTPCLVRTASGDLVVDGSQVLWGGTGNVWGAPSASSFASIWGQGIASTTIVNGNQVIWGGKLPDNGTLSNAVVWVDQVLWGGGNPTVDLSFTVLTGE